MSKKIKILTMGLLLMAMFLMTSTVVSAANYDVNTSTSNIQSYINGLPDGSTVTFQEGNYGHLKLVISRQLDIRTNGVVEFVAGSSSKGCAFTVDANNVNITGFKISAYQDGFTINANRASVSINNNIISNSTRYGIYNNGGTYANIVNNSIYYNTGNYAISTKGSNANIYGNTIEYGGSTYYAITIVSGSYTGITVTNNIIKNFNTYGIYVQVSNVQIKNNHIENVSRGICIASGYSNTLIDNNTIVNATSDGIYTQSSTSSNTMVYNNHIINNQGISINLYGTVIIINNTINNSKINAIYIRAAGSKVINNTLNNNVLTSSTPVIYVNASNTLLEGNYINNTPADGITIAASLTNINISNNIIENCLSYGIISESPVNITNNTISYNNVGIRVTKESNIINNTLLNNTNKGIWLSGNNIQIINSKVSGSDIGIEIDGAYNTVINSTIENNAFAINVLRTNAYINGSTIINNNRGIVLSHNNAFINYNRIYNNTATNNVNLENNGVNNNANFNWWGENNIDDLYVDNGSGFSLDYWYILQLSSNGNATTVNTSRVYPYKSNFNLSFTFVLNNESINNDPNLLPRVFVNIVVSNTSNVLFSITGDIRNPLLNSIFYSGILSTNYTINAISDNEDLKLSAETIGPEVNLTVVKTVNVTDTILMGDIIKYTITVSNIGGHDDAIYVSVWDILDSRLSFISANNTNYNAISGEWIVGNLLIDESQTLEIIVQANCTGNISNFANVTGLGNNTADNDSIKSTVNITVDPVVNITIIKSVNVSSTVLNGDLIKYSINVTNNGPNSTSNLVITDILDSRLIFNSYSTLKGVYNDLTGEWVIDVLGSGESVALDIFVQINGTGDFSNVATVTVDQVNKGDFNSSNSNTNFTVDSSVDIVILKFVNVSGTVLNGDLIKYTINVTNNGPISTSNLVVTDVLDGRLIFNSYFTLKGTYDDSTGEWFIDDLGSGESVVLDIFVQINGTGDFSNVATVTVDQVNNGDLDSHSSDTNFTAEPFVDIVILKFVNVSGTILNGDLIKYTINVTNNGPNSTSNLVIIDLLDGRLIFNSYSTLKGVYNNLTGEWVIGDLGSGESVVLDIFVQINGTGDFSNIATLTVDQVNKGDLDSYSSDTNFTAEPLVDIIIVKSVNVTTGTVFNNDLVKYTITVTNNGPDEATGLIVTDLLDSRLIYLNSISSQGTHDTTTGIWFIGNLSVGESANLEIFVKINGNGTIANTATLTVNERNIGTNSSFLVITAITKTSSSQTPNTSKTPTKIVLSNSKVEYGKNLQLKAILSSNGKVLSDKYVKFYVNGKYVGQAKTNSKGLATLNYKVKSYGKLIISAVFGIEKEYSSYNTTKTLVSPKPSPKIVYKDSIVRKGKYYLATYVLINNGSTNWSHQFKLSTKKYHKVFYVKVNKFKFSFNKKNKLLTWNVNGLKPYKISKQVVKMYILYDYIK